ncbi:MAG: hypothetical protein WEE89_18760 [Gemmatimonadota bacterium]
MNRIADIVQDKADSPELKAWVATWHAAGDALAQVRRDELRQLNTAQALEQLADAFEHALRIAPILRTSGLIDQQRWFRRLSS